MPHTPATFQPGQRVTLWCRPYGTTNVGTLISTGPEPDSYGVRTIRLDDGSLFRTEGVLGPIPS